MDLDAERDLLLRLALLDLDLFRDRDLERRFFLDPLDPFS